MTAEPVTITVYGTPGAGTLTHPKGETMPRYTRYLRLEKNIAASDTGGILERWRYGREVVTDPRFATEAGNLQHGALAKLIALAKSADSSITDREIQYRLACARAYPTEAEIRTVCSDFKVWSDLRAAGFPPVEVVDPGEPYDPHALNRKPPTAPNQEPLTTADGKRVPEFAPPVRFGGDEHGPRSTIEDLYAACKESEGYTERMAANDAKRRSYVDDLADAAGGDLTKTWYEAEVLRRGLDAFGLSSLDAFDEIMGEFFRLYDSGQVPDSGERDVEDDDE